MADSDDLESQLDAVRETVLRSPPDELPRALYHYTSAIGMLGIVQSGAIWATDARFTNDTDELKHADELVKSAARTAAAAATGIARTVLETFAEDDEPIVHPGIEVYVASFSEEPDLLTQWVSYADDGRGYAVGIETSHGGKNHPYCCGEWEDRAIELFRVRYEAEALRAKIGQFFTEWSQVIAQHQGRGDDQHVISIALRNLRVAASQEGLRLKHESSRYEREWRLVVLADPGIAETRFRTVNGVIVPFIPLKLALEGDLLPIHRVYVGPSHRAGGTLDVAMVGAHRLLHRKCRRGDVAGLVKPSSLTYRAL